MEVPPQWGLDSFEEMAVCFTAFHGGGLHALRNRAESLADGGSSSSDCRADLWRCGEIPSLDPPSTPLAGESTAGPSQAKPCKSDSRPGSELAAQEDSTDEEEMDYPSGPGSGRQAVPWAGFEKIFTFVRQKGKNVVVQCNCCLPAIKHLSSAVNSSSNLRKHLERAHPGMMKVIRSLKKAKKEGLSTDSIIFSGLADIVATARANQLPTLITLVHRTEPPVPAELPSHEDEKKGEPLPPPESTPSQTPGGEKEVALHAGTAAPAAAPAVESSAGRPEDQQPKADPSSAPPAAPEAQAQEDPPWQKEDPEQPCPARAPPRQPLPWSEFEKAFTFVRQKGGSVLMQCNYCLPVIKNVSTAVNSSTNLRKHLEKVHPEKLGAPESSGKGKKRGFFEELLDEDDDPPSLKILKQQQAAAAAVLERWGSGKEAISQKILNRKIMDFIVEETLPVETVDRPSFVGLVRLGLPKCLTIMCSDTLRESLERRAAGMRERLAKRLGAVDFVATTADCWTDGRKTFLGVTAHWISPSTLEREFGALACRPLQGPPTYEALAQALRDVCTQYRIWDKVVFVTTDNGSNFAKALRVGVAGEALEDVGAEDAQEEEEGGTRVAEVKPVPVSEILDGGPEVAEGLPLPAHRRCASHTLHLVATRDVQALLAEASEGGALGPFQRHFASLMRKCRALWLALEGSKATAESLHEQCGMYLKIPQAGRWASVFAALKQLSDLLSAAPLKVDLITDQCGLGRVTPPERLALEEYVEILGPLAQSLEVLQGENGMYAGFLLPTLHRLDRKLEGLEGQAGRSSRRRFAHGLPLLQGVRRALRYRFRHLWEEKELLLAACLHPRFKADWMESDQNAQKKKNRSMMEALLKAEIRGAAEEEEEEGSGDEGSPCKGGLPGNSPREEEEEEDFFGARIQGGRPESPGSSSVAEEEVERYLQSPVRELASLHAFPRVRRAFLRHNTALPSSAAVDYLFSTVGHGVDARRASLPDDFFEQLVLLRQNRPVF